jgi:hypothetical protein
LIFGLEDWWVQEMYIARAIDDTVKLAMVD